MKREKQEEPISDEVIDGLLKQGRTAEDINGLLKQFTKAVLERAMQAEMTEHLGFEGRYLSATLEARSRDSNALILRLQSYVRARASLSRRPCSLRASRTKGRPCPRKARGRRRCSSAVHLRTSPA